MNIKNTYFGFTNNMKPMLKAKVEKTLDKMIREDGQIMTEKEWIYNKLIAGYRPSIEENYQYWKRNGELSKPKTLYKLQNTERTFFEVTKTSYDYACYIVKNGFLDAQTAEQYITQEQARIEEEKRIKAEKEAEERAEYEAQKQREEQERQQKRLKQLTDIQNVILSFTQEELERINNITDYVLTEYADLFTDGLVKTTEIMLYYDIVRFIALAKLYPESAIESIKGYRNILDPNTKNPNRGNEGYIRRLKIDNDIRNMFFGITDNMPIQTIRDVLTGKITPEEAHNRMMKNEQRKTAQEAKMTTFYRCLGKGQFVEAKGEKMDIEGYMVYGIVLNNQYLLIEERTGISLGRANNKTEAIKLVKESIEKMGKEKLNKTIEQMISKYGLSPLVRESVAV